MKTLAENLRPALVLLALFALLTGALYPLAVTGLAQALMPHQANGSVVMKNGAPIGSELIGQSFTGPAYFHGRPSAAGTGYDAAASAATNLGPTSAALKERVAAQIETVRKSNGGDAVPVDLAAASGSGLDPDISPAAAAYQARRVAEARGLDMKTVQAAIERATTQRQFGILGEPRVNLLRLNMALDEMAPARR